MLLECGDDRGQAYMHAVFKEWSWKGRVMRAYSVFEMPDEEIYGVYDLQKNKLVSKISKRYRITDLIERHLESKDGRPKT